MQHHAVELESEPARQFGIGRELLLVDLSILQKFRDPSLQGIRGLYIPFIERQVGINGLVGDSLKAVEIERFRLVRLIGQHNASFSNGYVPPVLHTHAFLRR